MKLEIKVIKNFQEYLNDVELHRNEPEVFSEPTPKFIITTTNIKDEDIVDYIVEPKELSGDTEDSIRITKRSGKDLENINAIYTDDIIKELDDIIELANIKYRNGK